MRHKILVIKLAALGDVACAARSLADVFGKLPKSSEFHWLADFAYASFGDALLSLLGTPGTRFHGIDSKQLFQGRVGEKISAAADLLRQCRRIRPSAIVLLHRDARYRLALRTVFRGPIYSIPPKTPVPETILYQGTFERLRNDVFPDHLVPRASSMPLHPIEADHLGVLIGGGTNPKVTFSEKRWPHIEGFLKKTLENTEYKISLFGGPEDAPIAEALLRKFPDFAENGRLVTLAGKSTLQELPDVLRKLRCFVTIDSGLGHVASSVMTSSSQEVISLFGPTDPLLWAPQPRGEGHCHVLYEKTVCSPCYKNDGRFNSCLYEDDRFQYCMKGISVDEVFALLQPASIKR